MLEGKRILLIISGGIAAYKTLELIRLLRKNKALVTCVLTRAGAQFVTPLSVSSLSEQKVFDDLWSLTDEAQMGHIRLSREADLIIVAPATANLIAKMAHGLADDLASTVLLASNVPVLIAPAMNPFMWENDATQANMRLLRARGYSVIGPESGDMACNETGVGRMSEPEDLFKTIYDFFLDRPLKGKRALVTAGPTYEAIDPVRFIGNRSSGKQGYAIARALRNAGADVTLISGPTKENPVSGVKMLHVESAREMQSACESALPADICVCSAAVSDWRARRMNEQKIKKENGALPPALELTENPDILNILSTHPEMRPSLVIGFAAETEDVERHARAKLDKKGCDWIMANFVGKDEHGQEKAFGVDENQIYFLSHQQHDFEVWEPMSKKHVAQHLILKIVEHFDLS